MIVDDLATWAKRAARNMVSTNDASGARVQREVAACELRARRAVLEEVLLVAVAEETLLVKDAGFAEA